MQVQKEEILAEAIRAKAFVFRNDPEASVEILDDREPHQIASLLLEYGHGELVYAFRQAKHAGVPEHEATKYAMKVVQNRKKEMTDPELIKPGTFAVKAEKWTWAQIPNELITDTEITHLSMRVWCLLRTYAKSDGSEAYPNQERAADQLNVSSRSVQRAIAELKEAGWLSVDTRPCPGAGARHYNVYTLHLEKR